MRCYLWTRPAEHDVIRSSVDVQDESVGYGARVPHAGKLVSMLATAAYALRSSVSLG